MRLSPRLWLAARSEDRGEILLQALDLGYTLFDTAALYGFGANETLLGKVLKDRRARIRARQQMRHVRRRRRER